MGQIIDTVPNHMGVGTSDNLWWNDVLENGPASRFAPYFDIAWRSSPRPELRDKVLLPVLADLYGDVLEAGSSLWPLSTAEHFPSTTATAGSRSPRGAMIAFLGFASKSSNAA